MPGQGNRRLRLPSLGTESSSASASTQKKEAHRVVMMGAARTGKSSIISQFLFDKYLPRYKETVEELYSEKYYEDDGHTLLLEILDTSGALQFPAMRRLSITTCDGFILVFAVNDAESWEEVKSLRQQILDSRGNKVPIVVVGNKIDLPDEDRQVSKDIAEAVVKFDWQCGYVECSAKDNVFIIDVFKELLIQAKISYNLSPAVRRRRQSLPNYMTSASAKSKHILKRNSCTIT